MPNFFLFVTPYLGYANIPQKFVHGSNPIPLDGLDMDKDIVLIFPGAGGPDQNTEGLKNAIKESDKANGIDRLVYVYDWTNWRGNFIRGILLLLL